MTGEKRITDFFGAAPKKQAVHVTASVTPAAVNVKNELNQELKKEPKQEHQEHQELEKGPKQPKQELKQELKQTGNAETKWDKEKWVKSLDAETASLLDLEINTLGPSWLEHLHTELTKPYFLNLKRFLKARKEANAEIFPPEKNIYSWSRLSSFSNVKIVILGQDPYHNVGQAHGLAFSVCPPTPPPPSLVNIYKELKSCYPDTFEIPKHGSLVKWSSQGVLLLNACLTVEAHKPNSHSKKGWEQFTEQVIKIILRNNEHVVLMAWGTPAAKRIEKIQPNQRHLVLRSVHPSPLSASRGWFGTKHFVKANEWLETKGLTPIDWTLIPKTTQTPADEKPAQKKS